MKTIILIIQLLIFTTVSFCQTYKDSTVEIKVTKYPEDSLLVIEIKNTSMKNISIIQDIIIADCDPPKTCKYYTSLWTYNESIVFYEEPKPWSIIKPQIIEANRKHYLASVYDPDDLIASELTIEYIISPYYFFENHKTYRDIRNSPLLKNNLVRVEINL